MRNTNNASVVFHQWPSAEPDRNRKIYKSNSGCSLKRRQKQGETQSDFIYPLTKASCKVLRGAIQMIQGPQTSGTKQEIVDIYCFRGPIELFLKMPDRDKTSVGFKM